MKKFSAKGRLPATPPPSGDSVEILPVKKYAQQIIGTSEHTVRQFVLQNKLPHIRTGQGKRGKISRAEVGAVGLFEIGNITMTAGAIHFCRWTSKH